MSDLHIKYPDIIEHNNPILAVVDSDFVRGGGRVVADTNALYSLYQNQPDQLKANVTTVYVVSLSQVYRLVDISNASNASGWINDASNAVYSSSVQIHSKSIGVGGIFLGTDVETLNGSSVSNILDNMLFPEQLPTYTLPTISVQPAGDSILEVGVTVSENFSIVGTKNDAGPFSAFSVYKNGNLLGSSISGLIQSAATTVPDQFQFVNPNTPNYAYTGTISDNPTIVLGNTTYHAIGTYAAGSAKNDSRNIIDGRPFAVRSLNAPQNGDNSLQSPDTVLTGIYPYFWGTSATQLSAASIAASLSAANKVVGDSTQPISITFNASSNFIWFAVPHSANTSWYISSLHGSSLGGPSNLFASVVTINFNSPSGYWNSVSYDVYITNFAVSTTGSIVLTPYIGGVVIGDQVKSLSWAIADSPTSGQKISGNVLTDVSLVGKHPADFFILTGNIVQWVPLGITFNISTGTFNFAAAMPGGGNYLSNGDYITIPI